MTSYFKGGGHEVLHAWMSAAWQRFVCLSNSERQSIRLLPRNDDDDIDDNYDGGGDDGDAITIITLILDTSLVAGADLCL